MKTVLSVAIIVLCILSGTARHFCPPANFVNNSRRFVSGLKTAIISEIHGQLWAKTYSFGPFWTEYHHGDLLARSLFYHAGILGIDKIYLGVFFNASTYPAGPTVEDIYPSRRFCVADWHKLGVLDWRPLPYGGPVKDWPLDKDGKPTQDRDYYKTLRVYNPFYAEIRNQYDWVFVMDPDEQLKPVNFNTTRMQMDWCSPQKPPLMSTILQQMLAIATRHKLSSYGTMMNAFKAKDVVSGLNACDMGWSYCEFHSKCKPITGIIMPVHVWVRNNAGSEHMIPMVRSTYPGCYFDRLKNSTKEGQEEMWKSAYQTRYNPLLEGRSLHYNPVDSPKIFSILAPREFHGGMSLQMVHQRNDHLATSERANLTVVDRSLIALLDGYKRCMKRLQVNVN